MDKCSLLVFLALITITSGPSPSLAQLPGAEHEESLGMKVRELETEMAQVRTEIQQHGSKIRQLDSLTEDARRWGGPVLVLFGAFCALWAQNTGRSASAWFFLGLFFSVITVLVLLSKNSRDHEVRTQTSP